MWGRDHRLAWVSAGPAPGAMAFEQNFGDLTDVLCAARGGGIEFDTAQTGDITAVNANKMRVYAFVRIIGVTDFESPDMVTQFSPNQEIRVGQVDEVAEQRGLIEAQRNQLSGDLRMCQRRGRAAQILQNRQSRRSAAQSC